ncbi:hypothetical protein [Bermanella sp. R86510]|uniref:hypothetical protein n=1 Tax=unclassified Bermanella TaxID=2627862 RepID=UPI0037C880AD
MRRLCTLLLLCLSAYGTLSHGADLLPDARRDTGDNVLYGQALFHLHSGNYEQALSYALAVEKKGRRSLGREFELYKAAAQLGLGMDQKASQTYRSLISNARSGLIPMSARSQAWFYLAKHFYTKGWWESALATLRYVDESAVAPGLINEYHFLYATLELFVGQPDNADKHLLSIDPTSKWSSFAFLNLAVSYTERDVHLNQVDAAFSKALQLSENVENPDVLADKINSMAGQFFYATGRGRSAIKHLKEVSLDGAYTPKALLTYGWALTEQWQYHDALQPWYMLKTGHSQLNQDVQETLIAIPFLLEKLNAKVMALGAFEFAVKQYDEVYEKLAKSASRLNTGEFIEPLLAQQVPDKWGAFAPMDLSLPDHPDRFYLKDVMGQSHFQGELKNLRDLHVMRERLKASLLDIEAFSVIRETRQEEYQALVKEQTLQNLNERLRQLTSRYRVLKNKIESAFGKSDGSGLASNEEKEMLALFKTVNARIQNLNNADHYQARLRRVQGILAWNLSQRYAERKKFIAENLAGLERNMRKIEKQIDATRYAYNVAPQSYQGYSRNLAQLKKKYQNQLAKLDKVYQKQRNRVGSIVKTDIKQRQQKVLELQRQARLASARLFDETSNQQRDTSVAEVGQ